MNKQMRKIICLLLIATLLMGCQQSQPLASEETLPDDLKVIKVDGPMAYGIDTEGKLDGEGLYYPYTGGEMMLDLYLRIDGMHEAGVTILLFLNGQPQPYRQEGSEETAYMHTVYPKSRIDNLFGISFVPVTGSVGETLELCVMYLPAYRHANSNGNYPWYDASNAVFYMTRLRIEKMPRKKESPLTEDRVLSFKEHRGAEDMFYGEGHQIGTDGKWMLGFNWLDADGNEFDRYRELDRMRIYVEILGGMAKDYVLILYVDDQPVLWNGRSMWLNVSQDDTLLAEIEVDTAGFEYMMFAVLLEKEYFGGRAGWKAYPTDANFIVFCMTASWLQNGKE